MEALKVVLVGQPNVGKSSLINAISNAKMRVGNFSGVTLEKAEATLQYKGYEIVMIDLPGTYSLHGYTMEERVCHDFLKTQDYDIILNVLDSTNLENNLILTLQLQQINKVKVIALNMIDEAQKDGVLIDGTLLGSLLNANVCFVSSTQKQNLETLLDTLIETQKNHDKDSKTNVPTEKPRVTQWSVKEHYAKENDVKGYGGKEGGKQHIGITSKLAQNARLIANKVQTITKRRAEGSARLDSILLHKIWSIPIFLLAMFVVFELSFVLGKYFQDLIETGVDWLAALAHEHISNELLASLIGDGIIKGVGAVVSFLPLIATLFLGLTLLEGSGYMARVAFMLDGLFFKFGLHGKSFIPLVMGFGCSVPAYMATRTLQNKRDKLLTLFIIGFMSCSARLPIYLLFVGAFFSIEYAGFILFLIYIFGFIIALILAKILRICVFRGDSEPFVMEMPRYRIPTLRVVWFSVWSKSYLFLRKAGTVILLGAIFVWALANFPKSLDIENQYQMNLDSLKTQNLAPQILEEKQRDYENKRLESQLEYSLAGRLGHIMQPIFAPLGFDWRLSVALVTGFSAKEMVVTTLGVLYALGDQAADNEVENQNLQNALRQNIDTPAAVAFIFFIMLYIPCFAATIAFVNESGKKIYGIYLFLFTTFVAYVFAYIGHEVVRLVV